MDRIAALSRGPHHHFFGYYGISPWDRSLKSHLALETDFHEHRPRAEDSAAVGLIDAESGQFTPMARTSAFNLQQGSMLYWIDAGAGEEFTFNDYADGRLVSRAVNPQTKAVRTFPHALAALSPVKPVAIGLNFLRMFQCRPVVGYAVGQETVRPVDKPEDDGLFRIDLRTGASELVLSIAEVVAALPMPQTLEGLAWFNHVIFNTDGTRLVFLCRNRHKSGFHTSMWSVNPDGTELDCQIDYSHGASHFTWRDATRVVVSTQVRGEGMEFVEFTDRERDFHPFGPGALPADGHLSFSPDGRWAVCDAYQRGADPMRDLLLLEVAENRRVDLGRFASPQPFTGDIRCDLHPRWRPDGRAVSFDSIHEGSRQIYLADVADIVER